MFFLKIKEENKKGITNKEEITNKEGITNRKRKEKKKCRNKKRTLNIIFKKYITFFLKNKKEKQTRDSNNKAK